MNYDDWKLDENYPLMVSSSVGYEAVIDCKLEEAAAIVASFNSLGLDYYEIDGDIDSCTLIIRGEYETEVADVVEEKEDEALMFLREEISQYKVIELKKE